jgi:dolichol kinase
MLLITTFTSKVDGATTHDNATSTTITANVLWRNGVLLIIFVIALQVLTAQYIQHFNAESKRRIQHAITGHILVQISYYLPINICVIILGIASMIIYYLRTYQFDLYIQYFGPLLRQHEIQQKQLPGAFYFLVGTTITAILFPIHIARYSVQCLAIADPMAAYIGQTIISPKIISISSATISGSIACFTTAWIIGYIMLFERNNTMTNHDVIVITSGALACCITEAMPYGNDNLLIPIITAFVVHMVNIQIKRIE